MNLKKGAILIALLLMCVSTAYAEMKVATVDVDSLFDQYGKTIELNEKMEGEISGKQTERDTFVEEIRRMKDEMILLADDNKRDKQKEIDDKIQELQQFDEMTRDDLTKKRNEYMREILVELDEKVKEYGKEKGFDYILNSKLLLYSEDKYDVTDDLLKRINQ